MLARATGVRIRRAHDQRMTDVHIEDTAHPGFIDATDSRVFPKDQDPATTTDPTDADTDGSGPFHTLATFTQTKPSKHPEGYGLFLGGKGLDGAAQRYLYFLVRQDGSYLIKRREGEKTSDVSKGWVQHAAVKRPDAKGTATNLLEVDNKRDPSRVVIVAADSWRTKAAQAARDDARAAGRLPILAHKMEQVDAMVEAARVAIAASELADVFTAGKPEQTLLWEDEGIWCRARPDWLSDDHRVLVDYKTTAASAEPATWGRGSLLSMGYDLQAAMALRGISLVAQPRDATFVFLVQETEPPHAVSLIALSPAFQDFADRRLAVARAQWRDCLAKNEWPSYPLRIAWAEPPEYAVYAWGERMAVESRSGTVDDL